jgi:hypothetical protein
MGKPSTFQSAVGYYITREFIEVLDSVIELGRKTVGAEERDRYLALIACSTPYLQWQSENHKAERPLRYLEKYLSGDATDEPVDLFQLMSEDKAVRHSVHSKITTYLSQWDLFQKTGVDFSASQRYAPIKSLGIPPGKMQYKERLNEVQCKELLIDVEQSDFSVNDWLNATGSFQLNWELVDMRSDRSSAVVELWGSNTYRWHPEVPRRTQKLHQALEIMKKYGAREFDIVFRPCLMSVSSGSVLRA